MMNDPLLQFQELKNIKAFKQIYTKIGMQLSKDAQ